MTLNTKLVGISNYTPDSFSDRGKFFTLEKHYSKLNIYGIEMIDV